MASDLGLHCLPISLLGHKLVKSQPICTNASTLRKHAYSNIFKISPPKPENFQIKILFFFFFFFFFFFHISAQNIDCGYSLEPTIYVLSRNKKNNVYPCKPQFYYIKVGFKGVNIM